jgi:hypothetical protein
VVDAQGGITLGSDEGGEEDGNAFGVFPAITHYLDELLSPFPFWKTTLFLFSYI